MKRQTFIPYLTRICLAAILLFLLQSDALQGQTSLKGRLRDTAFDKDCPMAVVALLTSDSTLIQYTRTRKDGGFHLLNIPTGSYLLFITHPAYTSLVRSIHMDEHGDADLRIVALPPRADTLPSVIVTPRSLGPQLHGDTLEYNTAHVKTRINATVEELLTRLPGVQVDQDGNITVNGQRIQQLLVDGKAFFGDNPTIVTRNFNADMIAKAQVLDKKSKQAEFTGVDDGKRTKTLNLVLKEDSKKGYFLKAEAGGDTDGFYNANGLFGSFKGNRQLAALSMTTNTGGTGFNDNVGGYGASLILFQGAIDPFGATAGPGIPTTAGGGLHYANSWSEGQANLAGDYGYGRVSSRPFSTLISRQVLPDSIYVQQQQSSSRNFHDQHRMNASLEGTLDTSSAFNITFTGNTMQGHNESQSNSNSSFNDTLVNSSIRTIHSDIQSQSFNGSMMWRIRERQKKGRNFTVAVGFVSQQNTGNGFLYALNSFFQPNGALLRTDTTDELKAIHSGDLTFSGSLSYSQALWTDAVLALSYGVTFSKSRSFQSTYAHSDGKYDKFIDSLSNDYQNNVLTQQVTANIQARKGRIMYVIGGDILDYTYKQTDLLKDNMLCTRYLNFAPRINTRYSINKLKGVNIDYNGLTQQPSITQLQPVQNNNDPLHIVKGNPRLRESFAHNVGIMYSNFANPIFNLNLNFGFTRNSISAKTYTDTLGRQITQAVNVNGNYNFSLNYSFTRKIKPIDLDVNVSSNVSYNRTVNYVNQYLSRNNNYVSSGAISLNKFAAGKFSLQVNARANYTLSNSSINTNGNIHYWTQYYSAQLSIFFLKGFEINTNGIYNWRQKLDNFDKKNATFLLNASIGKDFLNNQLNIKWRIYDILGQNAGVSRNTTTNQTIESNYNVMGRYWMLSAAWRFVRHGKMK